MSQDNLVRLVSKDCPSREVYWTRKNKKLVERKLQFKKFCKHVGKHIMFTEGGKK